MIIYNSTSHSNVTAWKECRDIEALCYMMHTEPYSIGKLHQIIEVSENNEAHVYDDPDKVIKQEMRRQRMAFLVNKVQQSESDIAKCEAELAGMEKKL